jgi:hypothetical protein
VSWRTIPNFPALRDVPHPPVGRPDAVEDTAIGTALARRETGQHKTLHIFEAR